MHNYQNRSQHYSSGHEPNQYGAYGPDTMQGIGTTPTEHLMHSGMGHSYGQSSYGHGYPGHIGYGGGSHPSQGSGSYSTPHYGGSFQGQHTMGAYSPNLGPPIGTTPIEQRVHSSMGSPYQGGGSHWSGAHSTQSGGYGGYYPSGGQHHYQQPNEYGNYGPGQGPPFGTTPTEQTMGSQMGGLQQVMQADHHTGFYGSAHQQPRHQGGYGGSGQSGGYSGSTHSGSYGGGTWPHYHQAYHGGQSSSLHHSSGYSQPPEPGNNL